MFKENFEKTIVPKLMETLGRTNPMNVPRLEKIVVNVCTSEALTDGKVLDKVSEELAQITGQKSKTCRARKSIATFKLREGVPIACMVTLRKKRMYEFYNRLVNIALPRSRDFRGLSPKGFDGRGNYTLGLTEQIIFPEILPEKISKHRGMNISIVTSAKNNKEGEILLRALGFPLKQ